VRAVPVDTVGGGFGPTTGRGGLGPTNVGGFSACVVGPNQLRGFGAPAGSRSGGIG
jgi:hypothetical protein